MSPTEKRISEIIKDSGLTYSELARRVNVERSAVGKWVKTGKMSIDNFASLCSELSIDPNYLLYGLESKNYPNTVMVQLDVVINNLKEQIDHLENLKQKINA
jgi:transcriptional regulator with XRE-family HTH domain